MDGLIYLLNQSGLALAQANQQIEELTKMVQELQDSTKKGKNNAKV